MTKDEEYEQFKRSLDRKDLTPGEYEEAIRLYCEENRF